MNEQAKQALSDMLERALSGVDAAVEFSQAQLPDVAEQLLRWHMVKSLLFFFTGALMIVTTIACIRFLVKKCNELLEDLGADGAMSLIIILKGLAVVGAVVVYSNLEWLQILIAPKLYLLEHAASLVK